MSTPQNLEIFHTRMSAAIAAGAIFDVDECFRQTPKPPAKLLGALLHDVLDALPFEIAKSSSMHSPHLDKELLPQTPKEYERNQTNIAKALIRYGADLMVEVEMANTPAQRCFIEPEHAVRPKDAGTRWFAYAEIMQATLRQAPSWKPDYGRIFSSLTYVPEDREAASHRSDLAAWANTMSFYTNQWLTSRAPSPTALRLQMSAEDRAFWNQPRGAHCKAGQMPWMNHGNLWESPTQLHRALTSSGLRFAFDTAPSAESVIAKAKRGGKPPVAE